MARSDRDHKISYYGTVQLLLATQNPGKIIEIRESLAGLPLSFVTPKDKNIHESPEETGETFVENAKQKALFYHGRSTLPTLADDSGIIIDALSDELGIHTRRWGAGPAATDEEWIDYFLKRMRKEKNKKARFVCSLAHVDREGQLHVFEGICDGVITDQLEADYLPGLPLSACFRPDGHSAVFSALSLEQKNSTSHRGRALFRFRKHLESSF